MIIGVVGKPNVGKSTFFKAATLADVEIANYPFATVKPNTGIGFVKTDCVDNEFNTQCNPREGTCKNHKRFIPVKMIDVAGLVPGAHEGKGLGNEFLNDLLPADVLIHVIDASGSTNDKGEPVEPGTTDPAQDIIFLEKELDHWYLGIIKRGWEKFAKTVQQEKQNIVKALTKQLTGLKVTEDMIKTVVKTMKEEHTKWNEQDLLHLATELRKQSKPMIIAANKIDIPQSETNIKTLQEQFKNHIIIPCAADAELALKEADKNNTIDYTPGNNTFDLQGNVTDQQQKALTFIQNILNKYNSTGVQNILNHAVFNLLHYITIFPGGVNKLEDKDGNVLPDCFLMPPQTTALQFAFRLHTDIGNNFIKAIDVKTKKPIGKDHQLKNRDVIEIMTKK